MSLNKKYNIFKLFLFLLIISCTSSNQIKLSFEDVYIKYFNSRELKVGTKLKILKKDNSNLESNSYIIPTNGQIFSFKINIEGFVESLTLKNKLQNRISNFVFKKDTIIKLESYDIKSNELREKSNMINDTIYLKKYNNKGEIHLESVEHLKSTYKLEKTYSNFGKNTSIFISNEKQVKVEKYENGKLKKVDFISGVGLSNKMLSRTIYYNYKTLTTKEFLNKAKENKNNKDSLTIQDILNDVKQNKNYNSRTSFTTQELITYKAGGTKFIEKDSSYTLTKYVNNKRIYESYDKNHKLLNKSNPLNSKLSTTASPPQK